MSFEERLERIERLLAEVLERLRRIEEMLVLEGVRRG